MAYSPRNLSVLAYANGFTLWHYTTSDTTADVMADGYFGQQSESGPAAGDMIIANLGDKATLLSVSAVGDRITVTEVCR